MSVRPAFLSERPSGSPGYPDVLSDVLETLRFTTLLFGRFELSAPWALRVPQKATSSFYVLARGRVRLQVDGMEQPLRLAAGDVALVPHGAAHTIDDGARSGQNTLSPGELLSVGHVGGPLSPPVRLGGGGAESTVVSGCFRFAAAGRSPLLAAFPPAVRVASEHVQASPSLAATVQLLLAESASPGQGTALVLGRLADVLLVQVLRLRALDEEKEPGGWRALADPAIGAALGMIHARPGEAWSVERLAAAVGLSRSGFAARFHELVGAPPMHYLAEWRMAKGAQWLRETNDSISLIAERAGYESDAAFSKAFKRWMGMGPGAYRRTQGPGRGAAEEMLVRGSGAA
ncbi:AraC family transcriptional regulator [Chondromyces apiculatus]|uniref:HTH araC/xylS-type domain-containing protein n=1 Tax=Chondromyces apiculatus DSM 436 TaxID=1192034 RepID=A0A017TD48_9BACT|nr:AraC family transcriptional regulator [Chondromyces apiculatus]EYF07149.1 Hypothetical protein CAP_0628 [Chondromyces apiculatus DSM 436]